MSVEYIARALEYVRRFRGKTFVIKIGGEVVSDEKILDTISQDIVSLRYNAGINPIVVHGAGKKISQLMEELGITPKFVRGRRVTDERVLSLVSGVLQETNQRVVWSIKRNGGEAIGVCGVTGDLIIAERVRDLGLVGKIKRVNPGMLEKILSDGFIPVVHPPASDGKGGMLNVNADEIACNISSAMQADKLIIITDVPGVLRDPRDSSTLIKELRMNECARLIKSGVISGGMIPKVEACVDALKHGVKSAHIVGMRGHALLGEVFTDEGYGTMIVK